MAGKLGSLGISSGVLTSELLNKLKTGEETAMVSPYTKKIESNTAKQKALTDLKTKLLSFQTQVSSLGDSTAFAKRSVTPSVTGDSAAASLSASSGVSVQNLNVNVTQIAQKDVFQSKGLSSDTGKVLDGFTGDKATFTLMQDGKSYQIIIGKNDTYTDLVDKINNATDGKIQAKLINTGEANNPYRLTLSSKDTGDKNAITFVDGTINTQGVVTTDAGATKLFNNLGWTLDKKTAATATTGFKLDDPKNEYHIKHSRNAEFTLDGIKMVRQSNTVTDIGAGLTLTLKQKGEINFDVKQDTEALAKSMDELTTAYNDLMTSLQSYTKYDTDTKVAGELQGISEVTSIRTQVIDSLFQTQSIEGTEVDKNGNEKKVNVMVSLQDFGLTLSKSGTLSFDQSKFNEKVGKDVDFAEKFFAGVNGFEELNYTTNRVNINNDITFKTGDFKINFNGQTYDLSKNQDGTAFTLTGKTPEERMQNLVKHINSFRIEDLEVKMQELNTTNGKEYVLNFKSDNGSAFEISCTDTQLKLMGLEATKITPQLESGTGVFADLKSILKGMTSTKSGSEGSLTLLDKQLTSDNKSLTDSKKSTQERINARYDTQASKWAQYEKIINKLQQQGNQIANMINAMSQNNR